ncbi:MAG: ATP-dependent DNA helicase RecG, partial [Actinomycetota bacterium]
MSDTVRALPKGLELYAPERRCVPLKAAQGDKGEPFRVLGLDSVQALLQHYPRKHVDRTQVRQISQLRDLVQQGYEGEVTVLAVVSRMDRPVAIRPKGRPQPGKRAKERTLIKGAISDDSGTIEVTWFNQRWIPRQLPVGTEAFFYGKLSSFRGRLQMTAPRFEKVRAASEPFNVGRIIPIYPATADLGTDQLRRVMFKTLLGIEQILDPVPDNLRHELDLMTRDAAIRLIHFPETREDVLKARARIVFDEVFGLQLGLVYRKRKLERTVQGIVHAQPTADSLAESFLAELPFEPTGAQRQACDEVAADMSKPYPMHRLVEGEVGSGKTVVALYACLNAIGNGNQAAFMAPTEVLAEQHHLTVTELLDRAFGESEARNLFAAVSRRPVVRLLTGSTPAASRREILAEVAAGEVDLLIGTHALIQESVDFARLSVAVVDEQHRFGVHQRRALREKGALGEPDILVMTATPIPRTLAVTIYGDLDVSVLDELPKGRQPIETRVVVGEEQREWAYDLIRREVAQGRQAFIVYELLEGRALDESLPAGGGMPLEQV